jgi:hypothetical protein
MNLASSEPNEKEARPIKPPAINWLAIGLVVLATVLSLLPVLFGIPIPAPARNPILSYATIYCPALAAVVLCYLCDRRLERAEMLRTLLVCVVLTLLTNYLHMWLVDNASYVTGPNLAVQMKLHQSILVLAPDTLPHSYRFLPDSFVRVLEGITGDFAAAREGYRNLFSFLVLYALYRFARFFLRPGGALCCLFLWAAVTPVSFRYYAGQLIDPLSHLSFLLSFIFLETEHFAYLFLTICIGALAKETIAAMGGYYFLVAWWKKHSRGRAVLLVAASLLIILAIRALVLRGVPGYKEVSGVGFDHVFQNWQNYKQWSGTIFYTVGILVPFVALGWRTTPWRLRSLALYLLPVLFVSSLVFSWLREARNFMPLVAVLIVMTIHYLLPGERNAPASAPR